MPSSQPLRRSPRLAEKVDAKKAKAKPSNANNTSTSSSTVKTTRGRSSVANAKTSNGSTAVKSPSSRRSSSRSRSPRSKLCSLQSLETQLPLRRSTRRSNSSERKNCQEPPKEESSRTRVNPITITPTPNNPHFNGNRCVTVSPATIQSKKQQRQRSSSVISKGVKFNLARNSFAEYYEENPPNVVVHLIREFDDSDDDEDDGSSTSTTRKNAEILVKWEGCFDDESLSGGETTNRGRRETMLYDNKNRNRVSHSLISEDDDEVTLRNEMILAEWESHFDS